MTNDERGKERDETDQDDKDLSLGTSGPVSGQGRSGGRLARKIGTEDELKRAFERPAGATRVTKSDEEEGD